MYSVRNKIPIHWVFTLIPLVFFMACDEKGDDTQVIFDEEEQSVYLAEESAENLFDVVESITNAAISVSETSSGEE